MASARRSATRRRRQHPRQPAIRPARTSGATFQAPAPSYETSLTPGCLMRFPLTLAAAIAAATPAAAQQQAPIHPPPPPGVAAVRLTAPIIMDGRLDEAVWQTPNPATGF